MYEIADCAVCSCKERTIVCEYNRLIFIDDLPDSHLARYDYALCHGCGLVYSTRRPDKAEYDYLYSNFNEFLLKNTKDTSFNLDVFQPAAKEKIDTEFLPWQELEKTSKTNKGMHKLLRGELELAREYAATVTSHMNLTGRRLLHIRAKSSTLADFLRSKHGLADADIITLFPAHKYLAEKNSGFRVACCLNYERFEIPFDTKYDLIMENHMFGHTLRVDDTFDVFVRHINEGGYLFIRNEPCDEQMCRRGSNLFAELRPFHFQQFDLATFKRMLGRYGFRAVSIDVPNPKKSEIAGLAKFEGSQVAFERIDDEALEKRLLMYAQWRDESILSLPRNLAHALFADELPAVWKRVTESGRLALKKGDAPLALRTFHDANVPRESLEIARA